jgi:hypothetical protein
MRNENEELLLGTPFLIASLFIPHSSFFIKTNVAKLFIFAVGGTGARVLRSLTMLLASGVRIPNCEQVVPVLDRPGHPERRRDPHRGLAQALCPHP